MARTNCDSLDKPEWTENSRNTTKWEKSSTHEVRRVWDPYSCTDTNQFIFGSSVEMGFDVLCGSLPRFSMIPTSWQRCLPKTWDKCTQHSLTEPFSALSILSTYSALQQQLLSSSASTHLLNEHFKRWQWISGEPLKPLQLLAGT